MASPAQDVWSFGAMAYELMAAEPVFASDRADDNLTSDHSKLQLLNWLSIDSGRLAKIFSSKKDLSAEQRAFAEHLLLWCLQGDPKNRPTFEQVRSAVRSRTLSPATNKMPSASAP